MGAGARCAGSELSCGLGQAGTWAGLLVSTVFTLFLTPMIASLMMDFRRHRRT